MSGNFTEVINPLNDNKIEFLHRKFSNTVHNHNLITTTMQKYDFNNNHEVRPNCSNKNL